jgi:outer membrane protein OmpA-like peptidoglycan-associated protein
MPNKLFSTARVIHTTASVALVALALSSCSSPPKAPTVDDSNKRPVNSGLAIDLQACRGELSTKTVQLTELSRSAASSASTASELKADDKAASTAGCGQPNGFATGGANYVAIVPFAHASATWSLAPADADALASRATSASLVVIRGRTDATGESIAETTLARRRAQAAESFLRGRGVKPERMRVTWQGLGDTLPGLSGAERGQNRRVEVEIYAAAPQVAVLGTSTRVASVTR